MSLPTTLRAYQACAELFAAATADPKGARAKTGTYEAALNLRTRMHYFRKLDRDANATTYPADHPMHAQSLYDEYVLPAPVRDEDNEYWLYVEPRRGKIQMIEGLSDVGDWIDAEFTELQAIEPPAPLQIEPIKEAVQDLQPQPRQLTFRRV